MTGDPEGLGRTQFANATIPDSRISPISRKILALIPLPNLSGFTSNYYASAPGVFDRNNYDFKVDWVRSPKNTIWAKYSRMDATVRCPPECDRF